MADIERHPLLPATVKEAALKRIGALEHRGSDPSPKLNNWNILNWFVERTRDDQPAAEMPPSERQIFIEEYRALQELPLWGIKPPYTQNLVTPEILDAFRAAVRAQVSRLAKGDPADFGPFTVHRKVFMRREKEKEKDGDITVHSGTMVEQDKGAGLLYWLSTLFDQVGLGILHCPYCNKIFLQARKDARYCSRPCQANAHAKRQREAARVKQLPSRGKRRVETRTVRRSMKIQERPRRLKHTV